jgi:protein-disulfide isomerase
MIGHLRTFKTLLLLIIFLMLPSNSSAQLSCDDPPAPFDNEELLKNWQTVWDLMDVCKSQAGVFYEIISGGVGRDGIPPIDNPQFDDLAIADGWLQPASPVIAVEIDGLARAYPLAILTRHEIANDSINGTPVAVTFCPLCNSAIVFDRRVDGATLRFGVSGLLRNSDLIMWDDETQSLWQQLTGEGIVGAHTGALLDIVPSQLVGYAAFKEQYPQGEVLSTGGRFYGSNPYVNYDSSSRPFLFMGALDDRLLATERVLGALIDGISVAYPFSSLADEGVINDRVTETEVAAIWQPGAFSALDAARIDLSRDVGMAALYDRNILSQTLSFEAVDGTIVDVETGSSWNIFGTAIDGDLAGAQLRQINAFPHFWFAWAAFYPDTLLYGYQPPSAEVTARYELDPVLGDPDAPVTLIEYGAYGCHACKYWHEQGIVEALLEEFAGQVNFVYRDIPIIVPPYSQTAAEIAQCALDQGNDPFWRMHDAIFTQAEQGRASADDLLQLGAEVGLDEAALRSCYEAGTHVATVRYDHDRGAALGIRSTPTFVIAGAPAPNADPDLLRQLLREELDKLNG